LDDSSSYESNFKTDSDMQSFDYDQGDLTDENKTPQAALKFKGVNPSREPLDANGSPIKKIESKLKTRMTENTKQQIEMLHKTKSKANVSESDSSESSEDLRNSMRPSRKNKFHENKIIIEESDSESGSQMPSNNFKVEE